MTVARVALPVGADGNFDYWIPDGLLVARGSVVEVLLGGRRRHGVVVETDVLPSIAPDKLQPLRGLVEQIPSLPADLLELAAFVSRYYQQPLGMVLAQMLPPLSSGERTTVPRVLAWEPSADNRHELAACILRTSPAAQEAFAPLLAGDAVAVAGMSASLRATLRRWALRGLVRPLAGAFGDRSSRGALPPLNEEQRAACDAITGASGFAPLLLQGVTGSGKTEVYLEAAAAAIARGGQVLLLVPEINLTPQLEQRVRAALPGRVTVTLHSRRPAAERRRSFVAAARGAADLVLGTRLAVFTPLPRLALIVVDEEHEPSYKQQDNVRYQARDVAVWRARQRAVPVVLGSATPSLETLQHARGGRYAWQRLARRAVASAIMPSVRFVPVRGTAGDDGLAPELVGAIAARLERREQSLVFVNRRGFALTLLCGACGWRADCPHCSTRLVMHREVRGLRCHHCGHAERLPAGCPACGNVDLLPLGHGTQRLEASLRAHFPAARIARVDRDSTQRSGSFTAMREDIHAGRVDILVGTQMLAKGHDFPSLTLVGVLGADNALYSADFRATERLGALLFQVAGRAGRAERTGEVIVQTDFPQHPLYAALAAHDFDRLADALLAEREAADLPPFAHLVVLAAEAATRPAVDAFLTAASDAGRAVAIGISPAIEVFSAVPATLARRAGLERGQVVAQSKDRAALQRFLPHWRNAIRTIPGTRVHWVLDVDPAGFT